MKQILQDLGNGQTSIVEAPAPVVSKKTVLIQSSYSLISAGTERMLVDFGKANLLEKVMQQPDKVAMVWAKIQSDGLIPTLEAVKSKLDQPLPLGYCNVGKIFQVGQENLGFKVGDRVISNGPHAEVVRVPTNLCAKVPENVSDKEAAFTVLASIGLQGIRLAQPTLGETVVVTGVGLIGLMTVQMLKAQGCRVLAVDFDEKKLNLAKQFGAEICNLAKGEDLISIAREFSRGLGIDAVLVTASTKSSEPISQAAKILRKRGRIILVGVSGLELNRADFFEKEITFQVSCSYGPGRYDPQYEEQGHDYPVGFVRWTEKRNFEAVLDMLSAGTLDVKPLISHVVAFEEATAAYDLLTKDKAVLGILLKYRQQTESFSTKISLSEGPNFTKESPVVGVVGAGNYCSRILLPAMQKVGAQLHTLVNSGGLASVIHGKKFGFKQASSRIDDVFENAEVNTVVLATRHDSHAQLVKKAILAGKSVFVEKPLAIHLEEFEELYQETQKMKTAGKNVRLMVGFNRRFSPQIQKMKSLLDAVHEPKSFIMTMNAGAIPGQHWTQDVNLGGGRIIGEACHYIDLMRFLAGSEITSISARRMGSRPGLEVVEDKASITLGFADGSFGTIHYLANGSSQFPKERIEVFTSGRIIQLDNFRKMKGFGWPGFSKMNLWSQDKGQSACIHEFLKSVESGQAAPIPLDEIFEVAKVSIQAALLLRNQ